MFKTNCEKFIYNLWLVMEKNYYGVAKGHNRGVYDSWKECQLQIKNFRYAKFRKFDTKEEALHFAFPERYPLDQIEKEERENGDSLKSDHLKANELKNNYMALHETIKDVVPVIPETESYEKKIQVWIHGSTLGNNGVIGIFFQKDDVKNYVGYHTWKGILSATRLRLSACIKAIESLSSEDLPCTLIVITENSYLSKALIYWSKEWFLKGKNTVWAKSEKNHDLLETLCDLTLQKRVKMLCMFKKNLDENLVELAKSVENFK